MLIEKPYKIAIIDDDPLTLSLMQKVCQRLPDVKPFAYSDPRVALEQITQQRIRVAFVDINMPRMFGDDLLRAAMSLKQGLQIYIITGEHSLTIVDRCLNVGARDIIHKPFEIEKIESALRDACQHLDRWNEIIRSQIKRSA